MNEDLLSAYLDDELSGADRAAVESKLAESAEWRSVLDEVREAREAVRALPARDAPPGWWDHLLATTDADVVDLADARRRRRRRPRRWAAAASAAAAVVAVIVVGVSVVPGQDRVHPDVSTFVDAHAVRSSAGNDVISNVAGAAVPEPRP